MSEGNETTRKTALIITDLQNDFLAGGALPVPGGEAVVPIANSLMDRFDLVVATLDWHPLNHCSFAPNHPGRKVGDVVEVGGIAQTLWPVHCVRDTFGARLVDGLDAGRIDRFFRKGTDPDVDSYSAVIDNARRGSTGLVEYLKEKGVTDAYICGLATDYCIKHTSIDLAQAGFRTHVIIDACRGVELKAGNVARAIDQMKQAGVGIMRSTDVPTPALAGAM